MEQHTLVIIAAVLALMNLFVFFLYGIDKRKAKKGRWRISEVTLLIAAFLMGGVGSFIGMMIFRHKTKHFKFKVLVPLAILVNIGVVILLEHAGILR